MSLVAVYDALKAANVPDEKARHAVEALERQGKDNAAPFKEQSAKVEVRMDRLETRMDRLEVRMGALEVRVASLESWVKGVGSIIIIMLGVLMGGVFFG